MKHSTISIKAITGIGILTISITYSALAQTDTLRLEQAREMALQQNHLVKIQREKLQETKAKIINARSKNKPLIFASGNYIYNGVTKDYVIPKGVLGSLAGNPLPLSDISLSVSKHHLLMGSVMAYQPISQLGKIGVGIQAAEADLQIASTQVAKAELEIQQGVEKLYYGYLIAQQQREEATANIALSEIKLYDIESALLAGKTEEVNKVGLQADLANQQQKLLQVDNQIEDYAADLRQLTGMGGAGKLYLPDVTTPLPPLPTLESFLKQTDNNPDVKIAGMNIQKAGYGIEASKQDRIPNIGLMGGYTYQNVVPLLPGHNYFLGVNLSWNIIDFGKRRSEMDQYVSQKKQAEEYLAHTREELHTQVEKAYRKAAQSYRLIAVAEKAVQYRREEYRLKNDRKAAGLTLPKDVLETKVTLAKAEQDLYSAQIAYRIALTDLQKLTGNTMP